MYKTIYKNKTKQANNPLLQKTFLEILEFTYKCVYGWQLQMD